MLPDRIGAVIAIDPGAPAVEFEGQWRTWGELGATISRAAALVPEPGWQVGIVLRNRPASVGLLLGVLRAGGCIVAINPERPSEFAGPCLRADDLDAPVTVEGAEGDDDARPGTAVRMLTSGTTGPPKRVDLSYDTLERVLVGAKHYETNRSTELRLRTGMAVVNSPLVHLGGLFRVLQCISDGRPFALLERFTVDGWVDAVRRHRPATASLVPTALRMVLEADPDPADLSSLRSVVSGTAPLSPDDADAFTARYGVPVLVSYAATEFGGGVAGWNIDDHRRFWATKRGSVGRAHPGCELRVVDGQLEVKARQLGADTGWIRTTDLARIDDDGFLWILGRADQAIIRGGFKVHPDHVRAVLEADPRVRGAAVVGRPDPRLGAVPVAAVELRSPATPDELLAHAVGGLARYELPTEVRVVDELPRTPAGKVDLAAVRALFERWTFGVEPLPQAVTAAGLLRRVTDLVLALETDDGVLDGLVADLRDAEAQLAKRAPADLTPRIGAAAGAAGRVYVDHARDIGAFNPCFPEYTITVDGDRATGTVTFPIAFEGPPGLVHGGFLGVFFDCVMQHHSCDVGATGKTSALSLRYRRPTPLLAELRFELAREVGDGRITATGRLLADDADDTVLCEAEMRMVAGNRAALPEVSPRRIG